MVSGGWWFTGEQQQGPSREWKREMWGLGDRETKRWEEENRMCPQWEQTEFQPKWSPVCRWEKTLSEWSNKTSRHINFWPQFDCKLPPQPGASHSRGGEQHRFKWHLGRKPKKLCAGSHWIISPASYGKFSGQTTARFNVQVNWLRLIVPVTELLRASLSVPWGTLDKQDGWQQQEQERELQTRSKSRARLSLSCTVLLKLRREEEKV